MSSFGTEEGFAYFLRRSLAMMQMEAPWIYERMCAEVAGREIIVDVDGDRVILIFHETGVRLFEQDGSALAVEQHRRPVAEVSMSRAAILRLIDGETALVESILTGEVVVFARAADLAVLYDGLMIYLAGLVRCPSASGLLESFRSSRSTVLA